MTAREEVDRFADRLRELSWVSGLMVGGSMATGDHHPATSDVDLVALVAARLDRAQVAELLAHHRDVRPELRLGCTYVARELVDDVRHEHPTYSHGQLFARRLSLMARVEVVRDGFAMFGPAPTEVFGAFGPDDVRAAVRAELDGYWRSALWDPRVWRRGDLQDLAMTTMARAVRSMQTGELTSKTDAIGLLPTLGVPQRVVDRLTERRAGRDAARVGAVRAWRLTRRVVGAEGIEPPTTAL